MIGSLTTDMCSQIVNLYVCWTPQTAYVWQLFNLQFPKMCEPTQPISPVISIINSSISATIIRSLRTRTCSSLYNLPLHPAKESTHLKPIMIGPGKNIRVGRNTDDRFTYSFSSIWIVPSIRQIFVLSRNEVTS